jgi:hypothetical protein
MQHSLWEVWQKLKKASSITEDSHCYIGTAAMKWDSLGEFWLSKHLEKYQIPTNVDWLSWEQPVRKPWTSYVHQYARKGSHAVTQLTYNTQGRNPEVPIPELTRLKSQTSRAKRWLSETSVPVAYHGMLWALLTIQKCWLLLNHQNACIKNPFCFTCGNLTFSNAHQLPVST